MFRLLVAIFIVSCAIDIEPFAQAQDFVWDRALQELNANSTATITLQAIEQTDTDAGDDESVGEVSSAAQIENSRSVAGGGGGGGGAGAPVMGGAPGAGQPGGAADGGDGATNLGEGGKGGKKGSNGHADGLSLANGNNAVNANLQPVLEWSYLHSHDINMELHGGGGAGGGGGGGAARLGGSTAPGQSGASGGAGLAATGNVASRQESSANINAVLVEGPGYQEGIDPTFTTGWIEVDIGWAGTGVGSAAATWTRGVAITVNMDGATLIIAGGPTGTLGAFGIDSDNNVFQRSSSANLNAAAGSLSIGPGEFSDVVNLDAAASIVVADGGANFSRVVTQGTAPPGQGAAPGQGGYIGNGANGSNGMDGGNGGGAGGGLGGAGGLGFDAGNGGKGGNGGAGAAVDNMTVGGLEGMIAIYVDD